MVKYYDCVCSNPVGADGICADCGRQNPPAPETSPLYPLVLSWDERQTLIYGSTTCSCGSGRSPEECCG